MNYFSVVINLSRPQQEQFVNAINNQSALSMLFNASQLGVSHGDKILFTKSQIKKLDSVKRSGGKVVIKFSKKQIQHLHSQMGNGILDSIGSFFKSIPTKFSNAASATAQSAKNFASRAYRSVKNEFSPPPIMPPDNDKIWHLPSKTQPKNQSFEMKNFATMKPKAPLPQAWKEQRLLYAKPSVYNNMGFLSDDDKF